MDRWDILVVAGLICLSVPLFMLHWSLPFALWGTAFLLVAMFGSMAAAEGERQTQLGQRITLAEKAIVELQLLTGMEKDIGHTQDDSPEPD